MNKESQQTYNIVLADSHIMFRRGLKKIIQEIDGVEVLDDVSDGYELIELIKQKKPNLAIMEMHMPNLRGIEATREIKLLDPSIKVLMLTSNRDNSLIRHAVSAGIDGYLLKEDADIELHNAIYTIRKNKTYISPLIAKSLSEIYLDKNKPYREEAPLTLREKEILRLIAIGRSSKEIANILYIGSRTVQHHRANIMRKLNIMKTAELVKYAIEKGYVDSSFLSRRVEASTKYIDFNRKIIKPNADIPDIKPFILRSIEFPPEHYEAGMTILGYFGKVVRQKYPGMKVKVKIEQEDLTVRMVIQTDEGDIEKIEKTLEEYGLVIKGEIPITEFISDPYQALEMKQQLRIAYMQLENQKELLSITNKLYGERIFNLEQQVNNLHSHIAMSLRLLDKKENIMESAIKLIYRKLQNDINQEDFMEIKEALERIREKDKTLFSNIVQKINVLFIQGSISGVAGNLLYDFIKSLLKIN